jgi:hypothetical protein
MGELEAAAENSGGKRIILPQYTMRGFKPTACPEFL